MESASEANTASSVADGIGVSQTRPQLDEPGRRLTEGKREPRTFHGQVHPEAIKWCGGLRAEQRVWSNHVDTFVSDYQDLLNREKTSAASGITTSLGAATSIRKSSRR